MSDIATLQYELKEYTLQREELDLVLQADPDNADFQELKAEVERQIAGYENEIARLSASQLAAASKKPSEPAVKEKWSKENHPAYKKATLVEEVDTPRSFAVNDLVLAKWRSGDKGFYPARITSMTGSSTAPVYIVKFRDYEDTTETLRDHDIKPIINPNKRKADGTPVAPSIPSPTVNSNVSANVISAAADINKELAQQTKREPSMVGDGPARPAKVAKKIKAKKELEAGKHKWQDFAAKGPKLGGKGAKKESMFRTPEGVNGRVGFIGSGGVMRKDEKRVRNIYQTTADEEI
ncbi:Splicing factor spf30, partial [Lachnellula suecica]